MFIVLFSERCDDGQYSPAVYVLSVQPARQFADSVAVAPVVEVASTFVVVVPWVDTVVVVSVEMVTVMTTPVDNVAATFVVTVMEAVLVMVLWAVAVPQGFDDSMQEQAVDMKEAA